MASERFWEAAGYASTVAEALRVLGIERLVLAIHDSCFPSAADEELGRGSPYGQGAEAFVRFARQLGFTGLQLGPQGQTTLDNPSPYDGTLFSRNILSVALAPLTTADWGSLVTQAELAAVVAARPADGGIEAYRYAFGAIERLLGQAARSFTESSPQYPAFAAFCAAEASWLDGDALYYALSCAHGNDDWQRWPALHRDVFAVGQDTPPELAHAWPRRIFEYRFAQFIAHQQHRSLQELAASLELRLYGDLQVGVSYRDRWRLSSLFLQGYAMGAPPSRTTPEGQAWGFPVLDPRQYGSGAAAFVRRRMAKALHEFDGVRIDHPHGFVCPWVYAADTADPLDAVLHGARLFDSPDLPDHPRLADWAIARAEQIDRTLPRYGDHWVRALDAEQVTRYGALFDIMMKSVTDAGRSIDDVQCEVLSTLPFPLAQVMRRHGLGRLRVTQKASLVDGSDVYRSENAEPDDWIMIGNHDTAPLWQLLDAWEKSGTTGARAAYLAERLVPNPAARAGFTQGLVAHRSALAEAMLADLFASRAKNISLFFADLLGSSDRYNLAGTVDPRNWMLRVPNDYQSLYARAAVTGHALHLPRVLSLALRAKGVETPALLAALASY